jgi:hypothetical protein
MMIQYGATANFVVSYDSSFTGGPGQPDGPALAQGVLDCCEYDLVRLSMLFGNILPPAAALPIQINLVPGGGGANNNWLNVINCFCDVNVVPLALPATVVAEEAEIFMSLQAKGWIPNWSNGEALSRVCAQILYPSRSWLFQTGNSWLGFPPSTTPARLNWVDNVEQTDQDSVSTGCGTLFLNYLAYQLNFSWPDIIGAGAPTTNTLAETAGILGVTNAWSNFFELITTYLPPGVGLPKEPTSFGQPPEPTDNPYPLGQLPAQVPILYIRHNLTDDGTSHTGTIGDSPDIIVKNNPVADPQATYSTAASINSDTESDPDVLDGQANYVYTRVWNRGTDATNVFASVYWSPVVTLVTPNLWNLIGTTYYPDVPPGLSVQVSNPGITWPADQLPGPGHYCFVAAVGNAGDPAANPGSFVSFKDFENYIYANNNITWRNFNVVSSGRHPIKFPFGEFTPLRFLITGAWDQLHAFALETHSELPEGSRLALQVPQWLGASLKPAHTEFDEFDDSDTDPDNRRRLRLPLHPQRTQHLGEIELPVNTAAISHMLVHIPADCHVRSHKVVIRQLYRGREVGRITWLLVPPR